MKHTIRQQTVRFLGITGLVGSLACGSLGNLVSQASGESAATGDTGSETVTVASASVSDGGNDWTLVATGESANGLAIGDLQQVAVQLSDEQIEVTMTVGDSVPSTLTDDLPFYSLDFVVYDPSRATETTGVSANVIEQVSLVGFGPAGTALAPEHSVSGSLAAPSLAKRQAKYDGVNCPVSDDDVDPYQDDAVDEEAAVAQETSDEDTGIRAVIDGPTVTLTIPLGQLSVGLDDLCNLELGAIAQTDTPAAGHLMDASTAVVLNDGICAGYTRARCWTDAACTDLMFSTLVKKAECKEMGGKGWGPDADDCTAL